MRANKFFLQHFYFSEAFLFPASDASPSLTIADIARLAQVSVSTVSRILNGKPDVAEATRQRVLKVIQETGYSPDVSAQRLASGASVGRSRVITLLFPMDHAEFTQLELDFFIGAAASCSQHDAFFNLMTEPMDAEHLLNLYRSGQTDGVILMQIRMDDWRPPLLTSHDFPFIMIGRCADNERYSYIDLDFEAAVDTAFAHLVGLGHRRIGLLARPATTRAQQIGPAVRLMAGYEQALARYQLQPLYREVNLTVPDVYEATLALLDEDPELTAIVTVHGATSAGIIRALRDRDRLVPDDCSVVALATERIAQLVTPPLTAINFPTDTIGYQAATMLIHALQQPGAPVEQILLQPRLAVRESATIPPTR
jgi:DNA-binding LacI/PurR family transcriptional regulator